MSAWTDHIAKWAKENNTTYSCAISDPKCRKAYYGLNVTPAKGTRGNPDKAKKKPRPPKMEKPANPLGDRKSKAIYKKQDNAKDQMDKFKAMKGQRVVANAEPLFGISPQRLVANSSPPPPSSEPFGMTPSRAMGIF